MITNTMKGKSYLSNGDKTSEENRPKIPIYFSRDAEGTVTNYLIMAKTKHNQKLLTNQKPQRKGTQLANIRVNS